MTEGLITIKLEGLPFEQVERCRKIIHQMFMGDVFNIRNGEAIINFDNDGLITEIEVSQKTFSRRHEQQPELISLEQFVVQTNVDNSTVATSLK